MNPALSYLRISSATNLGSDTDVRQRLAIQRYAKRARLNLIAEFYDAAVSGGDHLHDRPGFWDLLAYAAEHGIRTVMVESASRFARDLIVQETGYAMLVQQGITLIASDDPDAFTSDIPMGRMVRQILGAVPEFERAGLIAKLCGARDRASAAAGRRIEGQKGYPVHNPILVREARRLTRANPVTHRRRSLHEIADELGKLGFATTKGTGFSPEQVRR